MSNDIIIQKKKLSKSIRKTIVDVGIRQSDVAYLIQNLVFNKTKKELVEIVEADDIPIGVQIFAHALLSDYKKGQMGNQASMIQWAFDRMPRNTEDDLNSMTEEEIEAEIKRLTGNEL